MKKNSERINAKIVLGILVVAIEIITEEDKDTKALDVIIKELTRLKNKRMKRRK